MSRPMGLLCVLQSQYMLSCYMVSVLLATLAISTAVKSRTKLTTLPWGLPPSVHQLGGYARLRWLLHTRLAQQDWPPGGLRCSAGRTITACASAVCQARLLCGSRARFLHLELRLVPHGASVGASCDGLACALLQGQCRGLGCLRGHWLGRCRAYMGWLGGSGALHT